MLFKSLYAQTSLLVLCLILTSCLEAPFLDQKSPGFKMPPNDGNATTYEADELTFSSEVRGVYTNVHRRAKYVQYSKLVMPFRMNDETNFQILNGRITSRSSEGISAHFPINIVYQILTRDKKVRVGEVRQGQIVQLEAHADYFLSLCYPLEGPKACENVPSNYFPGTIKEFDLQLIVWRGQGQAPNLELVCESDSGRTFVLNSEQISEVGAGPYFNKTHACGDSKKIETMHSTFMLSDDLKDWPRPGYSAWSVPAAELTFPFHYYWASLQYEPTTQSLVLACESVEVFSYDQDEREPDYAEKILLRACRKQLRF